MQGNPLKALPRTPPQAPLLPAPAQMIKYIYKIDDQQIVHFVFPPIQAEDQDQGQAHWMSGFLYADF